MTELSTVPDEQPSGDDDEISVLDLLIVLAKHKKLVLGLPLVVAVLAAGISLVLPVSYTGTTKILPPQQSQSGTAAMLAQLGGGLAGLAGGVAGIKSPNELYIGMLKSRTVQDNLIQRFDLNALYDERYQSSTRKKLEKLTTISSGKDGIITIEVDDEDAKRAAEIGCTGIVVSNHGGRQLDGSRASFDQLAEIVDAVGDRIDVLMDGGVQRGTHVL